MPFFGFFGFHTLLEKYKYLHVLPYSVEYVLLDWFQTANYMKYKFKLVTLVEKLEVYIKD